MSFCSIRPQKSVNYDSLPIVIGKHMTGKMRINVRCSLVQYGYCIAKGLIIRNYRVIISKQPISQLLRLAFKLHLIDYFRLFFIGVTVDDRCYS